MAGCLVSVRGCKSAVGEWIMPKAPRWTKMKKSRVRRRWRPNLMTKKICRTTVFYQRFRSVISQEARQLTLLRHLFPSAAKKISNRQALAVKARSWSRAEQLFSQPSLFLVPIPGMLFFFSSLTFSKSLCTATWDPVFQRAFVHTQRGQSCAHVGVSERRVCGDKTITHLELFPEEAVYLIERGALDCRWTQTPGDIPSSELFATSIPISVAQAYAQLLGRDGATLARYQIYAYLKRLGYIVQRTSVIDRIRQGMTATPSKPRLHVRWTRSLWQFLFRVMSRVWCLFFCLIRRLYRRPRGLLGIAPTDAFGTLPCLLIYRFRL